MRRSFASPSPNLWFEFTDECGRRDAKLFEHPTAVLQAFDLQDVLPALEQAAAALRAGHYVAGFVSYEASPAFDAALVTHAPDGFPLVWLGVFDAPRPHRGVPVEGPCTVAPWRPEVTREAYTEAIARIHSALARGESYQVNHTFRMRAAVRGSARTLYHRLHAAQQGACSAFLDIGSHAVLCTSPELFFRVHGDHIVAEPMKGTAVRGRTVEEDELNRRRLLESEKERAENAMIVDLMRNDLGRIARPGSVAVPRMFTVQRLPTVWQMTSTVDARLRAGIDLPALFAALFPAGSITGAPKAATMALIRGLEGSPRKLYCGTIGYACPNGDMVFNVAIRTVVVDLQTGAAECGVGGGITWDSRHDAEYAEALAKARFLDYEAPALELLETLRCTAGQLVLKERHLERIERSAAYFGYAFRRTEAEEALETAAGEHPAGDWRMRLHCAPGGELRVEAFPLAGPPGEPPRVALAAEPVDSGDRFLYHKTTHRAVYAAARAARPGLYDVILWNERRQVTEFTNGNMVYEWKGSLHTPPVTCGLLPGTFRAELLESGLVSERPLAVDELPETGRLWFINSVRGWVEVRRED